MSTSSRSTGARLRVSWWRAAFSNQPSLWLMAPAAYLLFKLAVLALQKLRSKLHFLLRGRFGSTFSRTHRAPQHGFQRGQLALPIQPESLGSSNRYRHVSPPSSCMQVEMYTEAWGHTSCFASRASDRASSCACRCFVEFALSWERRSFAVRLATALFASSSFCCYVQSGRSKQQFACRTRISKRDWDWDS